jgi:S-DNA-T family DNA segregation ATPase FtsK/SpoIIIE
MFDMHDDVGYGGHGPHGLVAGTTGSGKSELLQSVIISQCIHYHPHDIVYVLIDYKGGGMADVFKGIPHLAGIITNLGGAQTKRAMLSINSEIKRRQAWLAEYSVNHIDKYQKIYYGNNRPENMKPLPHLVIVADEFAELYHEQRDFINELVSAARVGRSLGVHLVLATQKPDGVVDDQIWSNSKFKMCLKVQTESDSNGVLKKPDAAFIREPGRAYIQIGNDEIYELFQSAYSGADYVLDKAGEEEKKQQNKKVFALSIDGKQKQIYPPHGSQRKESGEKNPSQLESVVKHIAEMAEREGIIALDGPWTEPLSETLYYNELPEEWKSRTQSLLSAVGGVIDDPRGQRKLPLEFDFASDGGLLIYGAAGSGKTTLLKTLCLSFAHRYEPDEVNIYIIDMGGGALRSFSDLPHCGGVLTVDQESGIRQFVRYLFRQMENRKQLFEDARAESFSEYRTRCGKDLPAIVVMVDGYAPLAEVYEDVDEQITLLSRDSARYGIFMVITGRTQRDIRYKLATNFKMALTYEQIDESYADIVGRTEGMKPEAYCGRGLVKLEKPLEFHTALPEYLKDVATQSIVTTREIIEELARTVTKRATPIPVMPEKVYLKDLNADGNAFNIGLSDNDLVPVSLDFADYASFIVTGSSGCGKSTVVVTWLKAMQNLEIYALDSSGAGFAALMESENVKDLSQVEDFSDFVSEFETIIDERRQAVIVARKSGQDIKEVGTSWKQIVFAFDKWTDVSDDDDTYYDLCKLLVRIIKKEQGLKIAVVALDTLDGFSGDYSDAGKAMKNEQTGLLLGSLAEQNLFDARLPYGTPEKEIKLGDGYLIRKSKYTGVRVGL